MGVAPTNGLRERRPRQAKRKAKAAPIVDSHSEESEGDESNEEVDTPQPQLESLDQFLGTVVAKVFDEYDEAFEGVVAGRKGKKFIG